MAIKPLGNRVVLQHQEEGLQQVGGIYIPDSAKEKPQVAKIVALGTDSELTETLKLKVGDNVLYSKYGGNEVEHEGAKFLIVSSDDILAVID